MSQSQITDCTMTWVRRTLCIALSELLFGASSDDHIPRASFSIARLLASCFFFGSGVCGESRNDRSFLGLDCRSFGVWNLRWSVALHDSLHTSQTNTSGMLGLDV